MHRPRNDIRRTIASALLAVFLVGGLLAPIVHRAHHGLLWATLHAETTQECDHAQHGDSFEVNVPDLLDDDCLLCVRHVLHFDAAHAPPTTYHDGASYAVLRQAPPDTPHFTLLPIRGPPLTS